MCVTSILCRDIPISFLDTCDISKLTYLQQTLTNIAFSTLILSGDLPPRPPPPPKKKRFKSATVRRAPPSEDGEVKKKGLTNQAVNIILGQ